MDVRCQSGDARMRARVAVEEENSKLRSVRVHIRLVIVVCPLGKLVSAVFDKRESE